jgi:hypothetical protein
MGSRAIISPDIGDRPLTHELAAGAHTTVSMTKLSDASPWVVLMTVAKALPATSSQKSCGHLPSLPGKPRAERRTCAASAP